MELKRPIGIVQRRGKELGKTAQRFMQLLLRQSSAGLPHGEEGDVGLPDACAAEGSPTAAATGVEAGAENGGGQAEGVVASAAR
jgi:hypothetical protein